MIVVMPVINIQTNPDTKSLSFWDLLGLAVWAVGFYFEAVGDYQV
jgi:steroid 5-alpha reductase family enzyme